MNRFKRYTGSTIIAMGTLLGCAHAFTAEDCASEFIHHSTPAPVKLEGGIISQEQSAIGYHGDEDDDWAFLNTIFIDCSISRAVALKSYAQRGDATYKFDKTEEVELILAEMPRPTSGDTLDYLLARADRLNVPTETDQENIEACGCKAFYPELRGDKIPYEVWYAEFMNEAN